MSGLGTADGTGRDLTVPEVADLLECNAVTVRGAVHRFAAGGFDAPADAPRPGRPGSVTREALAALLEESARHGRTWTAAALGDWQAAERGVRVSAAWLTELLHRDGQGTCTSSTRTGSLRPCPPDTTWSRAGQRAVVPCEDKKGRRMKGARPVWISTVEASQLPGLAGFARHLLRKMILLQ